MDRAAGFDDLFWNLFYLVFWFLFCCFFFVFGQKVQVVVIQSDKGNSGPSQNKLYGH